MLESPLRKCKHSYPIDFSNKKKDSTKDSLPKYQKLSLSQENPQHTPLQKKTSITISNSSISRLILENNKKPSNKSHFQFFQPYQPLIRSSISSQTQKQPSLVFQNILNIHQTEEPLKQIKKNNRIVIDSNLLKNPRVQFNEQKTIPAADKTIETITHSALPSLQKPYKITEVGEIKHQNFRNFEELQHEKQLPLVPEKPYQIQHNKTKRVSLLQRLNLMKITQKSQQNDIERGLNQQITSGSKIFRPQSYIYLNQMMTSSQRFQKKQKIKRANSSFDYKKKQNIVYINQENSANFSFNLPNLPLANKNIRFNKHFQENQGNLMSKFKQSQLSFVGYTKNEYSPHTKKTLHLDPAEINKLKSQIDTMARNRFKNQDKEEKQVDHGERQFTFQNEQAKRPSLKPSKTKKPIKKLEITYHVPLANLKRLCKTYLASSLAYQIAFKVPKIFLQSNLFSRNQPKNDLHKNALMLYQSLKISSKDLIIRRYSNCVMFISGHVVVMWYYGGKRYLGGWQYDYLDEGSRHGLGLQWQPDLHIYYGQFRNNKKHGLGALKEGPDKVTVGYWSNGKYLGATFKEENDTIEESQQSDLSQEGPLFGSSENQENSYTD